MIPTRTFYPIAVLVGSMIIALIAAFIIIIPTINPPLKDLQLLLVFMSGTGGATIVLTYVLYRRGVSLWFRSLRWTLIGTILLTVLLIFVNVWVTAQLMFISDHDLMLTAALLIFAGLISVFSVIFIADTLTDRIQALGDAAVRLSQGDLKARLSVQGNDELAQLSKTFNMMADTLLAVDEQKKMLEKTRRDLIAWISHDLRTPLTAIRAMNEAMLDGVVSDQESINRYLQNIDKEVLHLSRLIDDLFDLSQLDTGLLQIERQMTYLPDLISDTVSSLAPRASQRKVRLEGDVESSIDMVNIAPDKIQRALYNLLDNALYHTPSDGTIRLRAKPGQSGVEISVHNTGSPIPKEDLPHIFQSFYRGESSRSQNGDGYRGTGLGLAIARGFIEAHGGKIWVESAPDKGTTFTLTLPVSKL